MHKLHALNGYGVRLSTLYATLPQWQLPRISKSSLLDSSPAAAAAAGEGEVEAMVVDQVVKWGTPYLCVRDCAGQGINFRKHVHQIIISSPRIQLRTFCDTLCLVCSARHHLWRHRIGHPTPH